MSNSLDPDQARRFVGPGLDLSALERSSANDTIVGKELQIYGHHPGDQFPPKFLGFDLGSGSG